MRQLVTRRAAGCRGGGVSVVVGANLTRFGGDEQSSCFCSGLWRLLVRIVSLGEARVEYACSCSVGTVSIIRFCSVGCGELGGTIVWLGDRVYCCPPWGYVGLPPFCGRLLGGNKHYCDGTGWRHGCGTRRSMLSISLLGWHSCW
jgi:hypothetical protein